MNFTAIPEKFLRNNRSHPVFEIDGTPVAVRLLPANRAEEWCDRFAEIDAIEAEIDATQKKIAAARFSHAAASSTDYKKGMTDASLVIEETTKQDADLKRKRWSGIVAILKAYDPAVFTDEIMGLATVPQITGAALVLRAYNDPFAVTGSLVQAFIEHYAANGPGNKAAAASTAEKD